MPVEHIQLRPKEKPALAQKLATVPTYAGPTSTLSSKQAPSLAKPYFRPGAGSLEEALRAAQPATGKAIDTQAVAWAKRKEMVAVEQAKIDKEADALYGAVQDLSPKDQNFILSKVTGKAKPSALSTALGGEVSPTAIRTDPLMETMIDKHYIRLDENGQTYSWMLPEQEKTFVEMMTDPQSGELIKLYADGSEERTGMFTDTTPTDEAPTVGEQISLAKLQFEMEKYGQSNVETAIKQLGNAPIEGTTTIRKKGTDNYRVATSTDVEAYYTALEDLAQYIKVQKGGPQTMGDMEALYRNRPDLIKTVQQQLGMIPDGTWSAELGDRLYEIFTKEE